MNRLMRDIWLQAATAMIIMSAAVTVFAQEPEVNFDQGVDVKAVLENVKSKAAQIQLKPADFRAAFDRWERDCATISMGADETRSERIMLESRFYQERCYPSGPRGEQHCHEEWSHTERRSVRLELVGRGVMLPWERDTFRVCLDGHWINADVIDASHEYSISEPGWDSDTITATAARKIASLPDPSGVYARSLKVDSQEANYVVTYEDRWPSYYKGEQTVISVQLKRHRSMWFDDTLISKEFVFPTAQTHTVSFADFVSEFKGKLVNDADYYVKWRFKRAGKVSKDKWQGWWDTDKVKFHKGAEMSVSSALFSPLGVEAQGRGACWFKKIEKDQCVYQCRDGSTHTQPVREPDPWDRDGTTIACPQIVIPF